MLRAGDRLVRVHSVGGDHPLAWDAFRGFGPTKSRFDHHTLPARVQDRGIIYVARGQTAFTTAIAEYFQDDSGAGVGPIDTRRNSVTLSMFRLVEDVPVLDLDSGWITRAKGNQAIKSGPRDVARAWARAVYEQYGTELMGLAYTSAVWGPGWCVALWEVARDALPVSPDSSRLMSDPAMARRRRQVGTGPSDGHSSVTDFRRHSQRM